MASRRREMWTLLHNLVKRSETNLNDVFTFVDDLLCKEPSLLQSHPTRLPTLHYQDAFIVWLFRKFIKFYGNEDRNTDVQKKNIALQKKLLGSCRAIRPTLFKHIVTQYVMAISELCRAAECDTGLSDVFETVAAFKLTDPSFKDDEIFVKFDDLDMYIVAFLDVLSYSHSISQEAYPELFIWAMSIVFEALKECDLPTKLLCLHYCNDVYESTIVWSAKLEANYVVLMRAILRMWEQLPLWLHANCVRTDEVSSLVDAVVAIFDKQKRFGAQMGSGQWLFELACNMLTCIAEIAKLRTVPKCPKTKLDEMVKATVEFMLNLLMKNYVRTDALTTQLFLMVFALKREHPLVLRVLAVMVAQHDADEQVRQMLLHHILEQTICQLNTGALSISECNELRELLLALIFLEHHHYQRAQITALKAKPTATFLCEAKFSFPSEAQNALMHFDNVEKIEHLKAKIQNFVEEVSEVVTAARNDWLQCARLFELLGLLMESTTMRRLLNSNLQLKLIDIVYGRLKSCLLMAKNRSDIDAGEQEMALSAMRVLCRLRIDHCATSDYNNKQWLQKCIGWIVRYIFAQTTAPSALVAELRHTYCAHIDHMSVRDILSEEHNFAKSPALPADVLAPVLRNAYCTADAATYYAFKASPYNDNAHAPGQVHIVCSKCSAAPLKRHDEMLAYLQRHSLIWLLCVDASFAPVASSKSCSTVPQDNSLEHSTIELLFKDEQFAFIAHHLDDSMLVASDCLKTLTNSKNITVLNQRILHLVLPKFIACDVDSGFIKQIAELLLRQAIASLTPDGTQARQLQLLALIACCAHCKLSERWLFLFFKLTFFYFLHPDSRVVHEAVVCAAEMCAQHDIRPIQLWNWYRRDALNLIVRLAVYVYLRKGVRLTKSLKPFSKVFGFSCVEEFICKYYRLLTTMLMPYCVKVPQCKGLLLNISKIIRKPISEMLAVSFLRIYTHVFLTEEARIGNECIDLIVQCTEISLKKLMCADMKQTVSEILLYFNRNPQFVMGAFKNMLSTVNFEQFMGERFLGVITYFENSLGEANFEKPLKEEALYSLGQILRYVGARYVTQYRFKIIAMLSFVLSMNDRHLQTICLKIWNIFLHIVNVRELGPSLSRIVAALQPMLRHSNAEVNAIYEFLILENDSLLGSYISDLYFIESVETVAPSIRQCVARHTELLKCADKYTLLDKLAFLYKQVENENLQVRIYGLTHLRRFIAAHRDGINQLVLSEVRVNPLIEHVVEVLAASCTHEDRRLQLAAAKCLGELGAIDPSYLLSHDLLERTGGDMVLSIHTDAFAVMALTELCRAYQFAKNAKYVDSFSLAIQETLAVFGVVPDQQKKLDLWEALPTRMRQFMEPLLTSCYTGSRHESRCKAHPIFNSHYCRSYEDWAFAWAVRLIDSVRSEDTRHLLNAYKPSIRRDNNTLALFFPYILLHTLLECGNEKRRQIFEEFEVVFGFSNRCVTTAPAPLEAHDYREYPSPNYSADCGKGGSPSATAAVAAAFDDQASRKALLSEQYEALESSARNCTKLCSELIDFLQRWTRECQRQRQHIVGDKVDDSGANYKLISDFLAQFDKQLIARANYWTGEYTRALMYLEQYIEEDSKTRLQEQISFLIEIHGKLLDADSVEGAVHVKSSTLTLGEEILVNRIVDRPQETMACYEQLLSSGAPVDEDHIRGIINCYLRMDTPETALLLTDGLWQKLHDQYTDDYFKECKSELLWRLGRYDELEVLLEDTVVRQKTANWNVQCAEAFLLFRKSPPVDTNQDELTGFVERLNVICSNVLSTMRTCAPGIKRRSYPHMYDDAVKMHLLNEVEKNKVLVHHVTECLVPVEGGELGGSERSKCVAEVTKFFVDWDARLCVLQPIVRVLEPIFVFRRNLLIETKRLITQIAPVTRPCQQLQELDTLINAEIGKLWIRSIQMYREAGSLQQAHLSIMKAEPYAPKTLFVEKAKLLWQKGDQTNSIKLLEEHMIQLKEHCQRKLSPLSSDECMLYAEAKLLQATYNAEAMNVCSEVNVSYFRQAIKYNERPDRAYVQLAQYMEKIYDSYSPEQCDGVNGRKMILDIMLNYAKSMRNGFENVYQSLPRLISIWLEETSRCAASAGAPATATTTTSLAGLKELARKMNEIISNCCQMLPTAIFYTAYSQLLSRICHPSDEVFVVLRTIVIKLVEQYPHQSLWMLLPIFKSSYTNRMKRCKLIFTDARLAKPEFQKLLRDFNMLAERLIELTNKSVPPDTEYEMSALVKQLPRLFDDTNFSQILLPFEKYMQVAFPMAANVAPVQPSLKVSGSSSSGLGESRDARSSASVPTNPFPYQPIFICGFNSRVTVLHSAAKPKKMAIKCSDGRNYEVMVKPKDDLRKDCRLMEFNGLVKRFLHQDSQARHRRLRIRTYAAIPFNEECGLVEWLPRLSSFRDICNRIYRVRGLGFAGRQMQQYVVPRTESLERKRKVFIDALLARHPPVFHEWLRQRFPTPHSWYEARSGYVKTIAVMSMVGYILGLGDRHGENVLFDETNGDVVHVDFNCLFNMGESFAFPEVVPFRLTHNMEFAMGPCGVEGMYRKCCEITLRVLKDKSKTLMSVLRPCVYDLVALNRNVSNANKSKSGGELTDPKALIDVRRIQERLQGYVKKTMTDSMPLSTEGQVNFLIAEATSIDNLAAMYIGWGAYF